MAGRITLPFPTSSYSCTSWSEDDQLAIACEDHFIVITPRLQDATGLSAERDVVHVKANEFTEEEVPLLLTLSAQTFSISEEQSPRLVQSLEWSAPGLAQHQRSVLAVLSSNHILSLWDNQRDFWHRKVIINHALVRYYDEQLKPPSDDSEQAAIDFEEQRQVCQRVAAFAWVPKHPRDGVKESCQQLLTVATEGGHILFLLVNSPYDVLNPPRDQWRVAVVAKFNIEAPTLSQSPQSGRNPAASHMAWQAWGREGDTESSILAFINQGRLHSLRTYTRDRPEDTNSLQYFYSDPKLLFPPKADFTGPLRFCPQARLLLAVAEDSILCVDASLAKITASHDLDGRWDDVTGVIVTGVGDHGRVHITSLLSTTITRTAILSMPLLEDLSGDDVAWQEAITTSRLAFGAKNSLGKEVHESTWSIASSPHGDYIATVTTMQPSESLAYIIRAEAQTFVDFTRDATGSQPCLEPITAFHKSGRHVPSEIILFRIRRYLEELPDNEARNNSLQDLTHWIRNCFHDTTQSVVEPSGMIDSPAVGVEKMRKSLLDTDEAAEIKANMLAAIAAGRSDTVEMLSQRAIKHILLVTNVFARKLVQGSNIGRIVIRLHRALQGHLQAETANNASQLPAEDCTICDGTVQFESFRWARCSQGHRFSRCAVTFLTIQRPGVTKACAVCGMHFLDLLTSSDLGEAWNAANSSANSSANDAETVTTQPENVAHNGNDVDVNGPKPTTTCFAKMLLASCNVCVYCGGKFVS